MSVSGSRNCVVGIYEKRVYFFKILKILRRDLSLDNLRSLTQDLSLTIQSFFDSVTHCHCESSSVRHCIHAKVHLQFLQNLRDIENEMAIECNDTEGFRFFVYKTLVNYLLHANELREEAVL